MWVDKNTPWEREGMPYEQWRDKITVWIVKQHTEGKDLEEIEEILQKKWPGPLQYICGWFIGRQLYLWKAGLKRYYHAGKGRPKKFNIRDFYVFQAIMSKPSADLGYNKPCSPKKERIWTTARIRDAMRRGGARDVSEKTVRRFLKENGYEWADQEGWHLPFFTKPTPILFNIGAVSECPIDFVVWENKPIWDNILATPPDPSLVHYDEC